MPFTIPPLPTPQPMMRCPRCLNVFQHGSVTDPNCPTCGGAMQLMRPAPKEAPEPVPDGTLEAIRAIAAHVTDSRLAMAAIRVLLEEK